jgi:hypothetical protein
MEKIIIKWFCFFIMLTFFNKVAIAQDFFCITKVWCTPDDYINGCYLYF